MKPHILYFARGRGRGHALAALEIAERFAALRPGVGFRFVSYGTGAQVFRDRGHEVLDLGLPDQPGPFGVESKLPLAFEGAPKPVLVIAHEEFDVPLAARQIRVPCLFVTDWFTDDPEGWMMQSLRYAQEVVFLDQSRVLAEGVFSQPEYLEGKVQCVGPILRPLRYRRSDRLRARQEAGLADDALVVSVFIRPGRRDESVAPLSGLLENAFQMIDREPKLLLWGRDGDDEFDRIMAASDLVITKGNRNIVLELASMGVPSLSVSHDLNRIDDIRTPTERNNRTVAISGLDCGALRELIVTAVREGAAGRIQPVHFDEGASGAARRFACWIE